MSIKHWAESEPREKNPRAIRWAVYGTILESVWKRLFSRKENRNCLMAF
jgi:hypothetical protein